MKKSIFILFAFFMLLGLSSELNAQIKTPAPSPSSKTTQTVGLTDITVEYSRPSKKGREIFGNEGLVRYGETWRTGANKNTIVTFSDAVKVGGKDLKAGSYALYTIPGAEEWTVIFYTDYNNSGVPEKWDATKEAARLMIKPQTFPVEVETFLINIGNISMNSASLEIIWDNTLVEVPVEVDADTKVMKDIERVLGGPSPADYYNAGSYYHESGKDLNKALEYVEKAVSKDPKFWQVRRKSLILADMGRYDEAITTAKQSLKLAQDAGNMDYVRMNEKAISEWMSKAKGGKK